MKIKSIVWFGFVTNEQTYGLTKQILINDNYQFVKIRISLNLSHKLMWLICKICAICFMKMQLISFIYEILFVLNEIK